MLRTGTVLASALSLYLASVVPLSAQGPVILGGDDLTDHGFHFAPTVSSGWLYIQRALENLAPAVTRPGNDGSVAVLGSADSTAFCCNTGAAYHFAVPIAAATTSLSGVVSFHDGAAAINTFFANLASGSVNPAIIVTAGTDAANDLDALEGAALTANAISIANFVNSGGGLLSHGFGDVAYGWLSALIPGATAPSGCDFNTLTLTPEGQTAFPGLTNADIRSGPCHSHFVDHGLTVLARDESGIVIPDPGNGVTVAESESNGNPTIADPIALGNDYTATLSPSNESDFVAFSATAGQTFVATTVLLGLPDSTLRLWDTDGVTPLAFNDDFGGLGLASRIAFAAPATGIYFLEVQSFAARSSGNYRLELRTSSTVPGRDIIIGGARVVLPGQITLTPGVSFNPPGSTHAVQAHVVDRFGNELVGQPVSFDVISGPNLGASAISVTDGSGNACFAYTSNGFVGLDQIQASFLDPATGGTISVTARKYWDFDCQPNGIPDTCDVNCSAYGGACAQDFPGCGGSVDANNDGQPDECNLPPVAVCQNVTVSAGADCTGTATAADVDNGSFDPDGDPISLALAPPGPYPLGNTTVTLTVTDDHGAFDACTAVVTVVDTTPPVIQVGDPGEMWPPNHKYVEFDLSDCVVSIEDNCDGALDVGTSGSIVSISSDEPEDAGGGGDGHTVDDIVILSDTTFKLRRERQGGSNGRVYTIEFEVVDAAGNVARGTCYVGVPHDRSGAPAVDDGAGAGYTVTN